MVRLIERHSYFHYFYVIDGRKLVHISKHARDVKKGPHVTCYELDIDALKDKEIVEVEYDNVRVYRVEDLAKYEVWKAPYRVEKLSYLNNFELEHLSESERSFLETDWKTYVIPMINYVREYLRRYYNEIPFDSFYLYYQLNYDLNFPVTYLDPFNIAMRRKASTDTLVDKLHQLYVTVRIIDELEKSGKLLRTYLRFEYNTGVADFKCGERILSLWFQFDIKLRSKEFFDKLKSVVGLTRRIPHVPDLVILEGVSICDECTEITSTNARVRAIIELKSGKYESWWRDIYEQLIPLREVFNDALIVLASLRETPSRLRLELAQYKIKVVDRVYPGGRGEQRLLELVKSICQ